MKFARINKLITQHQELNALAKPDNVLGSDPSASALSASALRAMADKRATARYGSDPIDYAMILKYHCSKINVQGYTVLQLFVGLANPGKEYAETRHNAGAWLIEMIASQERLSFKQQSKFHGLYASASLDDETRHFLIPSTFMNHSGQSVRACMSYYHLTPENILVAHDDIDLPAGVIKLKFDGGDGGHNGLKDIIRHLGTKKFYRIRIGVGRPTRGDVVDYVLERPSKADRQKIDLSFEKIITIWPLLLKGQIQQAMQQLHTDSE